MKRTQVGRSVDVSLRDRIAAALQSLTGPESSGDLTYECMADMVITELGLRRETVYAWRNGRSHAAGIRYVTDWRKDA